MADMMRVYVTPAQFDAVHAYKMRLDCNAPPPLSTIEGLQSLLSQCALINGGQYDPIRHREGDNVQLIVIV